MLIDFKYNVGDELFVISNPKTPYMKIKRGIVNELSVDKKGKHYHITTIPFDNDGWQQSVVRYTDSAVDKLLFATFEQANAVFKVMKG